MSCKKRSIPIEHKPIGMEDIHTDNVVTAIENATPYQWLAGFFWYPLYPELIVQDSPFNRDTSLALFAVLSPQRRIERNWKVYQQSLDSDPWLLPIMDLERFKVAGIIGSGIPQEYLSGNKVWSFYANLKGNYNCVTVDRHAISLALGYKITTGINDAMYQYTDNIYKRASIKTGLLPAICQGIGWVVHRENEGIVARDYEYTKLLNLILAYILKCVAVAKQKASVLHYMNTHKIAHQNIPRKKAA